MKYCACRFLVPTHCNDGRPVEAEKFVEIKRVLDRQFNGCRFIAPSEGTWHGQVEGMHEIEVAVPPKRVAELRSVVVAIGLDLGQDAMYFDAPAPSVEIISIKKQR